jgi:oligopeptide/dipeptide ABC transporter ATP-binding protein
VGVNRLLGPLVEVDDLSVDFQNDDGWIRVVSGVSFDIWPGEVLGIVGESGSGKTVASMAIMQLIERQGGRIAGGDIRYMGRSVLNRTQAEKRQARGSEVAMIFQQPTRSLNPAFTVGRQIADVVRHHSMCSRRQAWERAVEMLAEVKIPDPARRARSFPHEFSGGMCQRVMIAMALACAPKVLIADEPSTALDVTVQDQILRLLHDVREQRNLSVVLITHDLGVVADIADRVAVMYAGEVVEEAPVIELFSNPRHPYTAALLRAMPDESHRNRPFATIPGRVPRPNEMPIGCRFADRCEHRLDGPCTAAPIPMTAVLTRKVRCIRSEGLKLDRRASVDAST